MTRSGCRVPIRCAVASVVAAGSSSLPATTQGVGSIRSRWTRRPGRRAAVAAGAASTGRRWRGHHFTTTWSPDDFDGPVVVLPLYTQRHVPVLEAFTVVLRLPEPFAYTFFTVV